MLDLLAQVPDVHVDGARIPVGGVAPDARQQHVPREHPTGGPGQGGNDLELDVSAGNQLRFIAKNSAGQFSKFLLVAFGAGPIYVSIEPAPAPSAS